MAKVGGGARKLGRNKERCQRYQDQNRREQNKISKSKKLIKNLSPDNDMRMHLERRIREDNYGLYKKNKT